jgi:hypothetical protein
MEKSQEWPDGMAARFNHWVEQFYQENTDRVFEPAIREFGKEQVEDLVTKRTRGVLQKTAEQFSQTQINQFLAAVAEERRYDEVQQFCGQIAECQRLWRILTEFGERDGSNLTVENAQKHVVRPRMRRANGCAPHATACVDGLSAGPLFPEGADSAPPHVCSLPPRCPPPDEKTLI